MTADAPTHRGRPRSEDRTAAIIEAASELLTEVGYDHLRVQDVAARAGVGLATIYRRWPTKEDLVAAAIDARPAPRIDRTGDPRADLHAFVAAIAADLCDKSDYMPGLMVAVRQHDALGDAVRSAARNIFHAEIHGLLTDYVGDDAAHIDFVCDAVAGIILYRSGMLDEEMEPEDFADEIVAVADTLRQA